MSEPKFVPKTVHVIYIASTPEKVWEALTGAAFTKQYFSGRSVEIEPKVRGSFVMRMPEGRFDIKGRVVEWDPPRRLSTTWEVDFADFRELPECLVTYEIEPMGESVKLTMTENPSVGHPRRDPRRRPPGRAADLIGSQELARNRQAGPGQWDDGSAAGNAGGGQRGCGEEALACGELIGRAE